MWLLHPSVIATRAARLAARALTFGSIIVIVVRVVTALIVLAAHAFDLVWDLLHSILDGIIDLIVILDGRGGGYQDVSEYSCR